MRRVALEELAGEADAFDDLVLRTPGIDRFCSSSAWALSAHEALMPQREGWVLRDEAGWVALARGSSRGWTSFLQPLEAMWGFASPFVGADLAVLGARFAAVAVESDDWRLMLLSGVREDSALFEALVRGLRRFRVGVAGETQRRLASLAGGFDGYLSRRSRGFRRNATRARRRLEAEGITFEWVRPEDPDRVFSRILEVEHRSWKGLAGAGIQSGTMNAFYAAMIPRLIRRERLRVGFARRDGEDVAFHFGAVFGDTYRGLQHSYDVRFTELSLGDVTHLEAIRRICEEGVPTYDLGQDIEYKRRWSDEVFETATLFVARR